MDKVFKALADPGRRLLLDGLHAEGYSRLAYVLEKQGDSVKLTVIYEIEKTGSKLIEELSWGCPWLLASLESFLETGESLEETCRRPEGV